MNLLMVPVVGLEPTRHRWQRILSFTRILEAHTIKRKIVELTAPKKPVKSTVSTGFAEKSSIPQGFSRIMDLTPKKKIGGPSEGHLSKI